MFPTNQKVSSFLNLCVPIGVEVVEKHQLERQSLARLLPLQKPRRLALPMLLLLAGL